MVQSMVGAYLLRAWLDDVDNQKELYFVWTVVVLGVCSWITSIIIHMNLYCENM